MGEQEKQMEQKRKEEERKQQEQARREEEKRRQEQARREEEERQNQATNARYDMPPEEDDIYDNMEDEISQGARKSVEEDDISFDPNDIISNIEMVDEGWWIGECHGRFGLF